MPVLDSNTKLLLQNNGFNAQSKAIKFVSSRMTVPDSADWISGTGDFTWETWVRFNNTGNVTFAIHANNGSAYMYFSYGAQWSAGVVGGVSLAGPTAVTGKWYHYALVRNGNDWRIYVNGKSVAQATNAAAVPDYAGPLEIAGGTYNGALGLQNTFDGWMKQFRVSNIARYTSDFTPSTSAFVDDANTKFLMLAEDANGATSFVDSEGTPKTITVTHGTPVLQYTSDYRESNFIDTEETPKLITSFGDAKIVSQAFNKSAGFFDGAGAGVSGSVQVPDHADFDLGSGDFTVEFWLNSLDWTAAHRLFSIGLYNSNGMAVNKQAGNGAVDIYLNSGSATLSVAWTAQLNTWHHFVVSRDSGTLRFYIDGIQKGSVANTTTLSTTNGVTIADWFGQGDTNFKGWLKEFRLSNSARYPSGTTFTPSTTQFTSDANTKLLLHMDTPATAPLAPAIKFDGTGDRLEIADSADWDFGTGDFTLETWFRFTSLSQVYLIQRSDANDNRCDILLNSSTSIWFYIMGSPVVQATVPAMVANRWYHVAVTRSGSTATVWLDGVSMGTASNSTDITSTARFNIGSAGNGVLPLNGWMKGVRISNSARYTTAFTPSQTPFATDSGTKLLILANENNGATTFVDSAGSPKTITTNGDCVITYEEDYRNTIFKDDGNTGHKPYSVATTRAKVDFFSVFGEGSALFDGNGDYLTIADSADWDFGTGSFTAECWVRFRTDQDAYIISRGQALVNNGPDIVRSVSAGTLRLYIANTLIINYVWAPILNQWYHIMGSRQSSVAYLLLNGTLLTSAASTGNITYATAVDIGAGSGQPTVGLIGLMDNIQISNVARQTATFNPPTSDVTFGSQGQGLLMLL